MDRPAWSNINAANCPSAFFCSPIPTGYCWGEGVESGRKVCGGVERGGKVCRGGESCGKVCGGGESGGKVCGGVERGGKVCRGGESCGKVCGGGESGGKVCGGVDGGGGARTSGAISISRCGMVEGNPVNDIILDTGCARTLVGEHLVPTTKKIAGEASTLRCAHGDTVLYPLAEVDLVVDGIPLVVKAALSATLPVSVLLGTDVPELGHLLQTYHLAIHTPGASEVYVVTRARAKELQKDKCDRLWREAVSQVHLTPITESATTTGENVPVPIGASLHNDLFTPYTPKPRLTRRA